MARASTGRKLFVVFNYLFLAATAAACLLPLLNVLAISFSSSSAVAAGEVTLWPVDFSLKSYAFGIGKP